jgi:hypothetical protein
VLVATFGPHHIARKIAMRRRLWHDIFGSRPDFHLVALLILYQDRQADILFGNTESPTK